MFVIDGEHVKAQPSLWDALGLRGNQSGPIQVDGVEIPGDQIVGPEGDGATSNDEAVDPWFLIGSSSVWNGIALGAIDIAARHTTRKRHVDVGMRVADYPTIQDYVGEAVMDTNACRLFVFSVAQAFDKVTDDNTRVLEPGETARADFLHWAWQIKFEAAKNVAHHVDKMLHACGGSGYKRDMELERYVRDAKAGWVMGPTNEVLRQFVGKAVLLGFDALDYWNQSYNRRVVENEVKKLDPAGKRELAEQLHRAGREGRREPARDGRRPPCCSRPASSPSTRRSSRGGCGRAGRPASASGRTTGSTVIDPDGGQPAELTVARRRPARRSGVRPDAPATVLAARELVPDDARAIRLFGPDGPPGARQELVARVGGRRGRRRARRPGGRRRLAGVRARRRAAARGAAPTREEVELPRAARRAAARLPRRQGLRARPTRSARASTSRSSTWPGRQCSDFLAFHAHKLDAGVERGLDPQVTRTLMGTAYPTVGLHSKYYDADMDPLCQVVQDTVGRHDSFALACTARYYEDLGYPGHVNCTENFNRQLDAVRDRAAKKGWAALNFFYNTSFDPDLVLLSDEPWSRPGRLRAAAGDVGPRLRLVGVPRRHRSRQRLGGHRRPRPRLLTGEPLLDGHRPPRHPGGRARADQGDGLPLRAGRR